MKIGPSVFGKFALVVQNATWLAAFEVLRVIMPFIALPYLFRTVGEDSYGNVVFAQAIVACFSLVVNFGLDVSVVRDVARLRDDKPGRDALVSAVMTVKAGLCLLSFLALAALVQTVPRLKQDAVLFYFAFLSCIADVLLPAWYYQGKENMKLLTLVRFFSVTFYTASLFIVIRSAADYVYIPLLQSGGMILSALVSGWFLLVVERIRFHLPSLSLMRRIFRESVPFFFSRASLVINSYMAKIMCGFYLSPGDVAAFDVAQKICNGAMIPMQMFSQALYPSLSRSRNRDMLRRGLGVTALITFAIALLLFFLSGWLTDLLSHGKTPEAATLLRILCLYIFMAGFSVYLGSSALISFGHQRPFNMSVILSSAVLLVCYALMVATHSSSIYLYAFTLALAEGVVLGYRFRYSLKYGLLGFGDMLLHPCLKRKNGARD
ncbi:MAG: oligosaccharide flippase family protein [Tannerella sp.]|jgi:PST family polysaccharide transporter|nr:oligosaccharide flippase family protein [Tannerella sp.]